MRLRLTIAYVGTAYSGWQVQPDTPTVQQALEDAVARIGDRRVRVAGASRTDAGVHAAGQVCHFDAPRELPPEEWLGALNAVLPPDVRVLEAQRAEGDFDARRHARRKRYVYRIDTADVASPFLAPYCWHCPGLEASVSTAAMARAAGALLADDLDQRRFASRPEDGARGIRPLDDLEVSASADPRDRGPGGVPSAPASGPPTLVAVTVVGRSFLRHAVRGMVGTLVEVARGRRSADELQALIRGTTGHRPLSCKAPAHGLCLQRVEY